MDIKKNDEKLSTAKLIGTILGLALGAIVLLNDGNDKKEE